MAPIPTVMDHVTVTWPGVPEAVSGTQKRASSPAADSAAKRVCMAAPPPQESALFYWRCFAEERSRAYNHTFGSGLAGPDFSDIRRQAGETGVHGPPPGDEPRREPSKQRRDRSRNGSGKVRKKRTAIQAMVRPLKRWLVRHRHNPYPSREEKLQLGETAGMNLGQVSTWFANARRRLKQVVSGELLPWQERVRLYNSCIKGNAELLSLSSEDSLWNEEAAKGEEGGLDSAGVTRTVSCAETSRVHHADPADTAQQPSPPDRRRDSTPPADRSPKYKKKMLLRYLSDTERYSSAADADDEASGGSRADGAAAEERSQEDRALTDGRGSTASETDHTLTSAAAPDTDPPDTLHREHASPSPVKPVSATQTSVTETMPSAAPAVTAAQSAGSAGMCVSAEAGTVSSGPSDSPSTGRRPDVTPGRPVQRTADGSPPRAKKRRPPTEQSDRSAAKRRLQFDEEGATKRRRLSAPPDPPLPSCCTAETVTAPLVGPACVSSAAYPGLDLSLCQPPQQHQQQQQQQVLQQQQQQHWEQYAQSMTLLPWVPVWAGPAPVPYWDGVSVSGLQEEAAYRQVAVPAAQPAVWECWPSPTDGRPAYLPLL